jgi:hypothetical protein
MMLGQEKKRGFTTKFDNAGLIPSKSMRKPTNSKQGTTISKLAVLKKSKFCHQPTFLFWHKQVLSECWSVIHFCQPNQFLKLCNVLLFIRVEKLVRMNSLIPDFLSARITLAVEYFITN